MGIPLPNPSVVNFHHFPTGRMDEKLFFGSQWDGRSEKFLHGVFFDNAGSIVLKGSVAGMGLISSLEIEIGVTQFRTLYLRSVRVGKDLDKHIRTALIRFLRSMCGERSGRRHNKKEETGAGSAEPLDHCPAQRCGV